MADAPAFPIRTSASDLLTKAAARRPVFWTVAVVLALTLIRSVILLLSPLELYPDEAQYWLWSRHLDWGYFSKPPMIAWLIRLSTAIGGNSEAWVRMSAPWLHGLAALALGVAGRRLYGGWTGLIAAALYSAMSGVQLSSAVIATDGPLMAFLALGVWAYAVLWTAGSRREALIAAAGLGVALGLGFLSKYAALYLAGGVILHAIVSPQARGRWSPASIALCVGLVSLVAAPNLVWNAAHHFQTLAHTASNADLGGDADGGKAGERFFGPRGPLGFLLGQFVVFGVVPFGVLVVAIVRWRDFTAPDRLLVWLTLPALVVVFAEASIARANANWAVAAYAPGAVLVAGVIVRWRAWWTLGWALAIQCTTTLLFIAAVLSPALADAGGVANAFKRARGWRASTAAIQAAARTAQTNGPLSAVAVDDRFLFNAVAYYGRSNGGEPAAALPAPLRMWVKLAKAANQAEAEAPLDIAHGARVLVASGDASWRPVLIADFARVLPLGETDVRLDARHARPLTLLIGQGFAPRLHPKTPPR